MKTYDSVARVRQRQRLPRLAAGNYGFSSPQEEQLRLFGVLGGLTFQGLSIGDYGYQWKDGRLLPVMPVGEDTLRARSDRRVRLGDDHRRHSFSSTLMIAFRVAGLHEASGTVDLATGTIQRQLMSRSVACSGTF